MSFDLPAKPQPNKGLCMLHLQGAVPGWILLTWAGVDSQITPTLVVECCVDAVCFFTTNLCTHMPVHTVWR